MKKFEVDIERTVVEVKTFEVFAEDEDEAISKAYDQAYEFQWRHAATDPAYGEIRVEEDTNWVDEDSDGSIAAYEHRMDYESDSSDVRSREFGGIDS